MRPHKEFGLSFPALLACYNAVPTVFWSILSFVPVGTFCYRSMERVWLCVFGFISLSAYALPVSQLRKLELSSRPATYRRLGVHWVNRVVQDGAFINSLLRRRDSRYRRLRSRAAAAHVVRTTQYQERFHWAMLLFFLLSSLYAIAHSYAGWALLITFTNVTYNLYPIWLQQYIRLRLNRSRSLP